MFDLATSELKSSQRIPFFSAIGPSTTHVSQVCFGGGAFASPLLQKTLSSKASCLQIFSESRVYPRRIAQLYDFQRGLGSLFFVLGVSESPPCTIRTPVDLIIPPLKPSKVQLDRRRVDEGNNFFETGPVVAVGRTKVAESCSRPTQFQRRGE